MKIINLEDKNFPEQLRKIKKTPQKIYVLGDDKILNNKSIAIVGSRNCTDYGKKQAQKFSQGLTKQNLQITSGLAIGIDTNAHMACISANGKTIAVLGCGFNNLYPKENRELFNQIIDTGGAIVSEYPPYEKPSSDKFRDRNRIVSGLSIATLIIEAAYRSGTTITARYTNEQGKPVFCIPNSLENNKGVGTNELIKKGAILVTSVDDILDKCEIGEVKKKTIIKTIRTSKDNQVFSMNKDITKNIKKEYIDIYNVLSELPVNFNDICKKVKLSVNEISSKLLLMEMEGLVKKVAGNNYIKIL